MSATRIEEPVAAARQARSGLHRTLDTFGWAAAGMLYLLLLTACPGPPQPSDSEMSAEANAAEVAQLVVTFGAAAVASATDQASGAAADAAADAAVLGPPQLGGVASSEIDLSGPDTDAATSAHLTVCLTATETGPRALFQFFQAQTEIDCQNSDEGIRIALDSSIQINDGTPQVILHEEATTSCNALGVTSIAFPADWRTSIPGFRHGIGKQIITLDAFSVQSGDEIKLTTDLLVNARLPADATFGSIEVTGSYQLTTDFGATVHPCNVTCANDVDCGENEICEYNSCVPFVFDGKITLAFLNNGLDVTVADHTPALQSVRITAPNEALELNLPTTPNQGIGTLDLGSLDRLIVMTDVPNVLRVDLDGIPTTGPGDVIITLSEGASDFVFDITIPDIDPTTRTLAAGTVRAQLFPGIVTLAQTGVYPITATITSADPDASGPRLPLTHTFNFNLHDGVITVASTQLCGNGVIDLVEECDDGNFMDGDGCSATCRIEPAEPVCGDGLKAGSEECDDGNTRDDDGCSATCAREQGYLCIDEAGRPSVCHPTCGDGLTVGGEECDDGNNEDGDGCSGRCREESCGDGVVQTGLGENCDDGNAASDDGCSATCQMEPGFSCSTMPGEPTRCSSVCGDGLIRGAEECDDGNTMAGDGCDPMCKVQFAYTCSGEPSVCTRTTPYISFTGFSSLAPKPNKDKVSLQGTFSWTDHVFDPASEGLEVSIEYESQALTLTYHLGGGSAWKTKLQKNGNITWVYKDPDGSPRNPDIKETASLQCKAKTQICTLKITLQKLDLPALTAGNVTITSIIGDDAVTNTQEWILKNKGKRLTTP